MSFPSMAAGKDSTIARKAPAVFSRNASSSVLSTFYDLRFFPSFFVYCILLEHARGPMNVMGVMSWEGRQPLYLLGTGRKGHGEDRCFLVWQDGRDFVRGFSEESKRADVVGHRVHLADSEGEMA